MNGKSLKIFAVVALLVVVASLAEAHKKFYGAAPQYQEQGRPERCVCDCEPQRQPILPNKPYYGSAGYAQAPPRPSGGYGNSGSYAVSGSYGGGGGQLFVVDHEKNDKSDQYPVDLQNLIDVDRIQNHQNQQESLSPTDDLLAIE